MSIKLGSYCSVLDFLAFSQNKTKAKRSLFVQEDARVCSLARDARRRKEAARFKILEDAVTSDATSPPVWCVGAKKSLRPVTPCKLREGCGRAVRTVRRVGF